MTSCIGESKESENDFFFFVAVARGEERDRRRPSVREQFDAENKPPPPPPQTKPNQTNSFSPHAQFHFSLTCGYFAWAALTTAMFGDIRGNSKWPFLHHCFVSWVYYVTLNPFIHRYGNLFLVFQASTWILDFYAILKILNVTTGKKMATLLLTWLHPFVFFLVRLLIGIPLSIKFQQEMFLLMVDGNPHNVIEVIVIVVANVAINAVNLHWFFDMVFGVRDPLKDFSFTTKVKDKNGSVLIKSRSVENFTRIEKFKDKFAVGHDQMDVTRERSFSQGRKNNHVLNIVRLVATCIMLIIPFCWLNNKEVRRPATLKCSLSLEIRLTFSVSLLSRLIPAGARQLQEDTDGREH